jgi:hypothetical protein
MSAMIEVVAADCSYLCPTVIKKIENKPEDVFNQKTRKGLGSENSWIRSSEFKK